MRSEQRKVPTVSDYCLRNDFLKEEIHVSKVKGLTAFVLPKKGFRKKYAEVFVHYGSNDNSFIPPGETERVDVPPGIAHFLEHKMFEKPWGEAFSAFAKIGASANAYTTNNYTSYLFWTLENFGEALKLLMEVALNPYFTKESVAKEQGIIGQEIGMYDDDPGSRLVREAMEALYSKHPVRFDIAGTKESIGCITDELLYKCHRSFYRPSNMSVFVSGDFAPSEAFEAIDRAMPDSLLMPYKGESRGGPGGEAVDDIGVPSDTPQRIRPVEPPEVGEDREVSLPVPTPLIHMVWKDDAPGTNGEDTLRQELATSILLDMLFGKSSAFFTEVYEHGLVDDLHSSYEAWPDYAYASMFGQSSRPEEFSERVRQEIEAVSSDPERRTALEEDFLRIKKSNLGRYVTLFDSFDTVGEIQAHLHDMGLSVFSYGEILRDLTIDAVLARLDSLGRERSVRVVIRDRLQRSK